MLKLNYIISGVILFTLMACGIQPNYPPLSNPIQLRSNRPTLSIFSQTKQKKDLTILLKQLFKKHLADDVLSMQDLEEISQSLEQEGISMFKTLHDDITLRESVYPISQDMLVKEFTKPSQADQVPPITSEEQNQLRHLLQPGDIILCGNNSSFVHAMLYIGQNEVIHSLAIQPGSGNRLWGVVKESLTTYFNRSERDTFVVLRSRNANTRDVQAAISYAQDQLGKGYDSLFLTNLADRFYCTELIYHALRKMNNTPRVYPHRVRFGWQMVTVEDFMDSPDLQTVWERNFKRPSIGQLHSY